MIKIQDDEDWGRQEDRREAQVEAAPWVEVEGGAELEATAMAGARGGPKVKAAVHGKTNTGVHDAA